MARLFVLNNLQGEYVDLVQYIARAGEPAAPRGLPTREVLDVTIHFLDTVNLLPVGVGRGVSTALNAYSAAALVAGEHLPEMAHAIAPGLAAFEADGVDRERYGPRTHDQLTGVVRHLVADPDTREAIAVLQPPRDASADGGRDFPCTTSIQFLLRGGALHMTVSMRSNDAWHGLSGDAWTFGQLQHTLAWVLGVRPGGYTHHAASLHVYESDLEKVKGLHDPDREGLLHVQGFMDTGESWTGSEAAALHRLALARFWARASLGLATPAKEPGRSVGWYMRRLRPFWASGGTA